MGGPDRSDALVDIFDEVGNQDTQASTTTQELRRFFERSHHLDVTTAKVGQFAHLQSFAALQYFWHSVLMVKLVVAYAKADFTPTFAVSSIYSNRMYSGRLRFEFLF